MNKREMKAVTDFDVKISGGRADPVVYASYKYWEIAGELAWRHVDRLEAQRTARWAAYAKVGEKCEIKNIEPNVIVEIIERNIDEKSRKTFY